MTRFIPLLLVFSTLAAGQADHQHHGSGAAVGKVHFPISCPAKSQPAFNHGMALLHSFEYEEAEKAFSGIAKSDEHCSMAHWGVAMANYHPLWVPPTAAELAAGRAAIARARAATAGSERERRYIEALAVFYAGDRPHAERALAYAQAMEKLYRDFPDDSEAAILYTLALNGIVDPTDKTYALQRKAGAIIEPLFRKQPDHPGLAHYLIHSYDYPGLAAHALAAARQYARIAPASPHALHMPSHIFTRLGLWEDCIASNLAAANAGREYSMKNFPGAAWAEQLHAMDYLVYGYLQAAQDREAAAVLAELNQVRRAQPEDFKAAYTFAASPARYVLERAAWKEAAGLAVSPGSFPWQRFPWAAAIVHFTRTIAAARTAEVAEARRHLAEVEKAAAATTQPEWKSATEVLRLGARAWVEQASDNPGEALKLARAAAEMEDASEKHPVTPGPVLPARELLADLLLEQRQPGAALAEYERALSSAPNRFKGLLGAARAARQSGEAGKARQHYSALLRIAPNANGRHKELAEARAYIGK